MNLGPHVDILLRQIQLVIATLMAVMCSSCNVNFSDPLVEGDMVPVDLTPYLGDWQSARATNDPSELLTVTLHDSELWVAPSELPSEPIVKLRITRLGTNLVASLQLVPTVRMKQIMGEYAVPFPWHYYCVTLSQTRDRVSLTSIKFSILYDAVQSGELKGHAVFEDNVHTVRVEASQKEVRKFLEKNPDLFVKNSIELEYKRVATHQ